MDRGGAQGVRERVGADQLERGLDAVWDDRSCLGCNITVVDEDVVDADRLQRSYALALARRRKDSEARSFARIAVAIPIDEVPPRIRSVCPG